MKAGVDSAFKSYSYSFFLAALQLGIGSRNLYARKNMLSLIGTGTEKRRRKTDIHLF
jgi:hypothetical protein